MTYVRRDNKWLLCDDTRVKVVQAVEPLWPSFLFFGKIASQEQERVCGTSASGKRRSAVSLASILAGTLRSQQRCLEVCAGVPDALQHE